MRLVWEPKKYTHTYTVMCQCYDQMCTCHCAMWIALKYWTQLHNMNLKLLSNSHSCLHVPVSQRHIEFAFLIHPFRWANVSLHQNYTSNHHMLQLLCALWEKQNTREAYGLLFTWLKPVQCHLCYSYIIIKKQFSLNIMRRWCKVNWPAASFVVCVSGLLVQVEQCCLSGSCGFS